MVLEGLDHEHPYLIARGLSRTTVETFGVGYCRTGSLAGWIAIPIHNAAGPACRLRGKMARSAPRRHAKIQVAQRVQKIPGVVQPSSGTTADQHQPLAVVEGFFGCMLVWQAGYRRVVALMGSSLSARQEALLVEAAGPRRPGCAHVG